MTVGIITEAIGDAMAKQVKRVNTDPKVLLQKLVEKDGIIATQKDVIRNLREEIRQLRAGQHPDTSEKKSHVTASAFARKYGVAHSTITRRYHAGKLKGYVDDKGHVFIRIDEIYTRGRKPKAS